MAELNKELYLKGNCSICPANGRSAKVPDYGNRELKVVFVGEAPSTEEVISRKPFVGASGKLLTKILNKVGLDRSKVVIGNAIKCKIDNNNKKELKEIMLCCRNFIKTTIAKANPKLIVTLGDVATKQILRKNSTISKIRGRFFWSEEFNCYVFPTYHPAHVLRWCRKEYPDIENMNSIEQIFLSDFKTIKEFISNGFDIHRVDKGFDLNRYGIMFEDDASQFFCKVVAFDLEWNQNGDILGISFSNEETYANVYIPENKKINQNLSKIFTNENIIKIVANRPIDELMLYKSYGLKVKGIVHDVFLMAHLVDENTHISLSSLANSFCSIKDINELAEGKRGDLESLPQQQFVYYACSGADATFRLYKELKNRLTKEPRVLNYYVKFLQPVSNMLIDLKLNGCKIDIQKLKENTAFLEEELKKTEQEIFDGMSKKIKEKYSDNLALTRGRLLVDWLFSKQGLGLKPKELTGVEKLPSLTEEHLKNFSDVKEVSLLLKYKKIQKLLTTYLRPMYKYISDDGRIYPNTFLYRTVTGRTAMTDPPIQQIPQRGSEYVTKVKEIFVPDEGFKMISMDLSQSELRIMAWQANEKTLLDAFEKGEDPHILTASYVLNKKPEEVTKQERQSAKGINFGFIYGMSAESFVTYALDEYGVKITLEEAQEFRRKYFEIYSSIASYHLAVEMFLRKHGFVFSPLGRKRRLPAIFSPNKIDQSHAKRQAINMRIQSFSSDLCLLGMYLFNETLKNKKLEDKCKVLWSIHDAIFIQAREDFVEDAIDLLYRCLTMRTKEYIYRNFNLVVNYKIEAEAKAGNSWADLKPFSKKE